MSAAWVVRRSVGALAAAVMLVFAGGASAYALAPWWGLGASARPTVLQPGTAQDEVQELKVAATGGEFVIAEPARLKEVEEGLRGFGELLYAKIPYNAPAAVVQADLEADVYGAGSVEVAGGPGDATGSKPYLVTFTGPRGGQPVALMNTQLGFLGAGLEGEVNVAEAHKGRADGELLVTAENRGNGNASGAGTPVVLTDTLPAGLTAVAAQGIAGEYLYNASREIVGGRRGPVACTVKPRSVSCSFAESLRPYEQIEMLISVHVDPGASSGEVNEASVSGGGAVASRSVSQPVALGGSTPFGAEYGMSWEEAGGAPATQAGSHPYQLTTTLTLNQTAGAEPVQMPKDLYFQLPAGLTANVTSFAQCSDVQFEVKEPGSEHDECPAKAAIGTATLTFDREGGLETIVEPLFNMTPLVGEPARFGFDTAGGRVTVNTSVRTGGDYGVTASTTDVTQVVGLLQSKLTFWGVPGDPSHDSERGWNCALEFGPCTPLGEASPRPLFTLPTSCAGPLQTTLEGDLWSAPGVPFAPVAASTPIEGMDGCNRLQFTPSITVTPEGQSGSTPTGLGVDVHIPQPESAEGLAEGNLKRAAVTLPAGVVVNPGAANGLQACTPQQIGMSNANPVTCPEASKVGTAEASSPALADPLVGAVYVAQQGNNPFGSLLALYLVVEGDGVLVKSAGEVRLDPSTGQITTVFDNIPQQPVLDIRLHLFGGPRATLLTPPGCGTYTTTSQLTPYNSPIPAEPTSAFQIVSGADGAGCGPQPFAPALTAGTTNNQAGAFSAFTATFSRQDQEQEFSGVSLTTPPGLLGVLKSVPLCPEPQAGQGACGAESLIGHTTVAVGAGPDPAYVTGQVFLTGPYRGGPFGLSIVVPAAVGPFHLGNVVVRAAIHVDPHTAQITVTSDPLPTILQGIPLHLKAVNVTIDRAGFLFNPTSCEPLAVTGTLTSTQGASAEVSSRFQAANCQNLPFHPSFTVSTQAKTTKAGGASLDVKYTSGAGQANTAEVAVTLPKQLPSRLTTIQQACPEATFAANPASCPAGSVIGTGTAITPVLANPATGPAYLVSHGGAAFPDLVVILQGEGVTVELVGSINIKGNVTSSTFASVPDAPISTFQLVLPEGPHSALTAVLPAKAKGSLCGQSLTMPTAITGQNGARITQNTKLKVTGCTAAKTRKKAKAKRRKHGKQGKQGKAKKGSAAERK